MAFLHGQILRLSLIESALSQTDRIMNPQTSSELAQDLPQTGVPSYKTVRNENIIFLVVCCR